MDQSTTHDASHDPHLVEAYEEFLGRYYRDALGDLARRFPDDRSLTIGWHDLFRFDAETAEAFLADPDREQELLDEALGQLDLPVDVSLAEATVRVDLAGAEAEVAEVGDLRAEQQGEYVAVRGQVARASEVAPVPETLAFDCDRCGYVTTVPQLGPSVTEPHECAGCERQGPFTVDIDDSTFRDRQILRLKQPPEDTATGNGASLDVYLHGDAVEAAQAGDRAVVSGTYRFDPPSARSERKAFDVHLRGRAVHVEDATYADVDIDEHRERVAALAAGEEGDPYDLLVDSIAPGIVGHDAIKEAIALALFGGVAVENPDGTRDRGDSHVLLVGDPSTAKSTMIDAAAEIAPTAATASGKGATAAGMTASAKQDDFGDAGEWSLDAGALVHADGGVCAIDEIDKVPADVRSSLHSALAQQRVDINKAGINTTLPTRCAVLAAGNPSEGRWNDHLTVAEQLDLGPTLLSRFDLIFTIRDEVDKTRDREIASKKMRFHQAGIEWSDPDRQASDAAEAEVSPAVGADVFRAWIALAKRDVRPAIPEAVGEAVADSFVALRTARGDDDAVPVTHRVVDAVRRLAQASARIRLADTVTGADVERAQRLVGESLQQTGVDPETGKLDADVVATGESMSQRERRRTLKKLIREADDGTDAAGASVADIEAVAEGTGYPVEKLEHDLDEFRENGTVYEPQADRLKVVE